MAFLALYRKFRPNGFDGVIGQEHIIRTLTNQVMKERVGHAYLFCGARGTGKTSVAKIFARAINCLTPIAGSPCGMCETCRAFEEGTSLDIYEIDAASNNKVENIRDLKEKAQYNPVGIKYKVYIIDEAHMLTQEAFNALLKTLEEPPTHVVFILATTEPQKIPATIISRCMRFDFRLLSTEEISRHISYIYDSVGKAYDKAAVDAIARAGNGSVRDALSIADICMSYGLGKLTYEEVLAVLGASDERQIFDLIDNLFEGNTGKVLSFVNELYGYGKSVGVICRDVISQMRNVMVAKTTDGGNDILKLPKEVFERVKKSGEKFDVQLILRTIEILSEAEAALKFSNMPTVTFEIACVRACSLNSDDKTKAESLTAKMSLVDEMIKKLSSFEKIADKIPDAGNEEKARSSDSGEIKPQKDISRAKRNEEEVQTPTFSENYRDEGYPEPPPEENGYFSPSEENLKPKTALRAEKKEGVEKKPSDVSSTAEKLAEGMSVNRLWGTVLRKLRADGEVMLWVACQEMKATLKGKTLVITADEGGYKAISKLENVEILSKTVKSIGDYDVEIAKKDGLVAEDPSENDYRKLEENFADKIEYKN
ncbi:MAG: DNA polymerase III subunit gamma/tau [Clostridia bacterium]|nr:DNA polymerase III subunit gamma/tau [Clostridia bacterium]